LLRDETLRAIFSFLDEKELCTTVFHVSRKWRRIGDSIECWKEIANNKENRIKFLKKRIAERGEQIQVSEALQMIKNAKVTVNKRDLGELRTFSIPPAAVQLTFEALAILLGYKLTNWLECKKMLADNNLISRIENFDPCHIAEDALVQLKDITGDPLFSPAIVATKSKAAASVCAFIHECVNIRNMISNTSILDAQEIREKQRQLIKIIEMKLQKH